MIKMNVAKYIVEFFNSKGINYYFGHPDGMISFLTDEISKDTSSNDYVFLISYSFPEEKITKLKYKKNRILARIIPGIKNSYIYDDKNSYYKSYRDSYFGLTTKKGGWDCLRHYEIIANNCIPYFPDLELCPKMTLHSFPKDIILETNEMFEQFSIGNINHYVWSRQQKQLFRYMNDFLTTEVVAMYLVNKSKEFYNFNL